MRYLPSSSAARTFAYVLSGCASLCCSLCSCNLNPPRGDVVGTYLLKGRNGDQITLTLSPDGSFNEKIMTSGNLNSMVGTWALKDGDIDFDRLWIPAAFAPEAIKRADMQPESRQPKYSDPGHWVCPAEKLWGRTKIEVFPDDDVVFTMVSREHLSN